MSLIRFVDPLKVGIPTIQLSVASVIWGFGFVSTIWALEYFSPLWLTCSRFLAAALVTILGLGVFSQRLPRNKNMIGSPEQNSENNLYFMEELQGAFLPGFFLALALTFQTKGLLFTTVYRSGFITTLYVIFVPVLERLYLKKEIHPLHSVCVLFALVGTALICQLNEMYAKDFGGLSSGSSGALYGDGLTLIAALMSAGQIVALGHVAPKIQYPFRFNAYQALWAGLLTMPFALWLEGAPLTMLKKLLSVSDLPLMIRTWVGGYLFLVIGSSILAFYLQVKSQKTLKASTASMLCLLESPFAALFGWLVLAERFSAVQAMGAVILMASVAVAVFLETHSRQK